MRRFLSGFTSGIVFGIAGALAGLVLIGHLLDIEDPLAKVDVIVALSGDQGARTDTAVDLWKRGYAPTLLFAGSALDPASISSADIMKREAMAAGVPAAAILVEPFSATTEENATRVVKILRDRGLRTAILVTSPYHQRRAAILFARATGPAQITLRNYPARDPQWDPNTWWLSEPARSLTFVELAKLSVELGEAALRRRS
ncbi:MAG TPA: YdcF family protein [Candidatus Saccharimonadales bacterium]|nr:YdcF family protein [Candidatus Saccharimonadales bacterium]